MKRVIKKILRIILALMSCFIIVVLSCCLNVKALDESFGIFFDEEYPILYPYNEEGISPIYDLDGYTIHQFYDKNGEWIEFNQAVTLPSTARRKFLIEITFPKAVEKGASFDLGCRVRLGNGSDLKVTYIHCLAYGEVGIVRPESKITVTQSTSVTWNITSKDFFSDEMAINKLQIWFNATPSSVDFSVVVAELSVTGVSSEGLLASIGTAIANIVKAIVELPSNIASAFSSLFDMVIGALSSLGDLITGALSSLGTLLVNTLNSVKTFLGNLLQSIIDGLIALGKFLIDGLKSLFIPNDKFFSSYFDDLYDFFSEKLGILFYPFSLLITLLNKFLGISSGSGIIHIPDISINNWHIISALDFNLKNIIVTALGSTSYNLYLSFVDVVVIVLLVNYARKMFDEVVGGHTNDS